MFQLLVDNVVQEAAAVRYVNAPAVSSALQVVITSLTAGVHTVSINWYVNSGTGQIRPIAAPTAEFATLIIMEVLT